MEENIHREPLDDAQKLERRIYEYLAVTETKEFSDYLKALLKRLQKNPRETKAFSEELDRSYQMYQNRLKLRSEKRTEEVQQQPNTAKEPEMVVVRKNTKQKDNEFFVGTVLLSILGGAFVLTALVMLGMYYMNGFLKGMCLYGGAILLLLFSEFFLYRKWPKLGMTFTAISIGGLYLTTVLNYLSLGNFNMWVAMGITLFITIFVILLSWKRDSLWYRALGIITCYLCFLIIQKESTMTEMIVLAIITFFINMMCIIVPIKQYRTGFSILHMYINGIFTFIVNVRFYDFADMELAKAILAGSGMLVMYILLVKQILLQRKESEAGKKIGKYGIVAAYFVSFLYIYAAMPEGVRRISEGMAWLRWGSFAAILLIVLAAMFILRKGQEVWYPYLGINLIVFQMFCVNGEAWEKVIGITALLVISKLLSLLKVSILRIGDAMITTFACIMCLGFFNKSMAQEIILIVGLLLSILCIRYWQTYYEVILTFALAFFSIAKLPELLRLPVVVGIMFVGILLFNNVKSWQGKNIQAFNVLALVSQSICFLGLMAPIYRNEYLVYLCMLIFGLATIVLTFQEKYHMNFKCKYVILAIFLSYMALIVKTDLPIVTSILLMLIALICVGVGFYEKEKGIRIYGLVLSFIVCGKIALYDFFDVVILQKTILFLIVGILALAISAIYIILEKKMNVQQTNDGEK